MKQYRVAERSLCSLFLTPGAPVELVALKPGIQTDLAKRLIGLWERTGDNALRCLGEGRPVRVEQPPRTEQEQLDWVSTSLMNCYKNTGDSQVFELLFELNQNSFMQAIRGKIRRSVCTVDPQDVLQEVFLNIYRYPHRFMAEKADSFRNWGHRIARNTLLKSLKGNARHARFATLDEEIGQREDCRQQSPLRSAQNSEGSVIVDRAYLIYLNLYLMHFGKLSVKEQRALTLVEVDGATYKEAASDLGIRLENLKMVIFRGRRKIFRGMGRTLRDLDA